MKHCVTVMGCLVMVLSHQVGVCLRISLHERHSNIASLFYCDTSLLSMPSMFVAVFSAFARWQ